MHPVVYSAKAHRCCVEHTDCEKTNPSPFRVHELNTASSRKELSLEHRRIGDSQQASHKGFLNILKTGKG